MNANELRIGNYVLDLKTECQILGITKNIIKTSVSKIWANNTIIKPIPITEKWLLDFGFEKVAKNEFVDNYNKHPLQIFWNIANGFEYFHEQFGGRFIRIKYIHQLQNLYFALTGEELIKD